MDGQTVTLDEIRQWPPTASMEDASRALGISKSHGYKLAKDGKFPCRVVPLGEDRIRIVTASLLALLEEPTADRAAEPEPALIGGRWVGGNDSVLKCRDCEWEWDIKDDWDREKAIKILRSHQAHSHRPKDV